ncbi:MAG: amino acid permease [Chitinophagaceae bacterium]|nr:amino acid permease [Chitinophagaceae bacterium]
MKDKLGLYTATSLVIGNMIGAGVFLLPSAMASFGGISLLGWVLSAAGVIFIAHVFSETSKLLPNMDGGPYSYTRQGFGDFTGFLMAWGYWISIWCASAAIAVSLVSALSTFFPILSSSAVAAVVTGLGAIWLLTWVNSLGIKVGGEVQLVTTVLKLLPLVFVSIVGIFFIRWENFTPFNRSGSSTIQAITTTATMALYAYLGVECATIPAGSIANPEKNVPRATILGTLITALVYLFGATSVMGMLSAGELQHSVTPYSDAAAIIAGRQARYWVSAGIAVASFGALNGWILMQGQITFAVAKDKLFPPFFEKLNRKGAPSASLILSSVLISLIMMMNYTKGLVEQFKFVMLLSTLCSLLPFLFVSAGYVVIVMEKRPPASIMGWLRVLIPAVFAFVFSLLAVIGAGEDIVFWGFVLLLAGVPFYVWNIWRRRILREL